MHIRSEVTSALRAAMVLFVLSTACAPRTGLAGDRTFDHTVADAGGPGSTGTIHGAASYQDTVDAIRAEALRSNDDPGGRPLPLAVAWGKIEPEATFALVEQGHHVLPVFLMSDNDRSGVFLARARAFVQRMAEARLPLTILTGNPGILLRALPEYRYIDDADRDGYLDAGVQATNSANACFISTSSNQICAGSLDPFGPAAQVALWKQEGAMRGACDYMRLLCKWYPSPDRVIVVANNEAGYNTRPSCVVSSQRYQDSFVKTGKDAGFDFVCRMIGDNYIARMGGLLGAWRASMPNSAWAANTRFIGYEAIGSSVWRMWPNWIADTALSTIYTNAAYPEYQEFVPRADARPLAWDGAVPSYYLYGVLITDYTTKSPQIAAMNWLFMIEDARKYNPEFWFDIVSWCGAPSVRAWYTNELGQTYTPERYEGLVQFGLWLTRPRAAHDYWQEETANEHMPYLLKTVAAVDRVYRDPVLSNFWRTATLVENTNSVHPFQFGAPAGFSDAEIHDRYGLGRWFLLDTTNPSLPPRPWDYGKPQDIAVFSLALTKGDAPNREWLVYAHSPVTDRSEVGIAIPAYGSITVSVSRAGSFYHVTESTGTVQERSNAPAVLSHIAMGPRYAVVATNGTVQFTAVGKDQYGNDLPAAASWSASGGSIDANGLYTAPAAYGTNWVAVTASGLTNETPVYVDDLVAHLDFEEGQFTVAADTTGHFNDAGLPGPSFTNDSAQGAYAVALRNNAHLNCGRNVGQDVGNQLTVSAWIKAESLFVINWIVGKGCVGAVPRGYHMRTYNGMLQVVTFGSGGTSAFAGNIPLATGVWYHVAGVYKGGQYLRLYTNGVLAAQATVNVPVSIAPAPDYDLEIGSGSYCTYPWRGLIDDVRIYNRALRESEIRGLAEQ